MSVSAKVKGAGIVNASASSVATLLTDHSKRSWSPTHIPIYTYTYTFFDVGFILLKFFLCKKKLHVYGMILYYL